MFCLFSSSKCANVLQICGADEESADALQPGMNEMHSSEAAPPGGPGLLLQLGQLILRARSASPHAPRHKHKPSTSQQVLIQTQPKVDEEDDRLEDTFRNHINALWTEHVPICVEVILAPSCSECYSPGAEPYPQRGLLLERWTMTTVLDKSESPSAISSPWLLNAVRSQLHFSQLAAWRARTHSNHKHERRRKLSREINIKKVEANIDNSELNVVYSVRTPAECASAFAKPPTDHTFPLTDIGSGKYLKVSVLSLPRLDGIPTLPCACQRAADDLAHRLTDLTIGSRKFDGAINSNIGTPSRRLSIISNPGSTEYLFIDKEKVVDDRMHTPCSENGKHKCNCDDESDSKEKNQTKKLDERRLKEIAKYKRRIRKEVRKFCDSTSSEGEVKKETTSIPILQAARFDRFRAIGCYRNQTYLTLPASRMEMKSPFQDTDTLTPPEYKTSTVSTQTDFTCACGNLLELKCDLCVGMVRSEGNYNLASLQNGKSTSQENGNSASRNGNSASQNGNSASQNGNTQENGILNSEGNGTRRKLDDVTADQSLKKQKCDNIHSVSNNDIIKRPKLRRFMLRVDKLGNVVTDRNRNAKDMQDLHLKTDDSVFSTLKDTDQFLENETGSQTSQFASKEQNSTNTIDNPFSMEKGSNGTDGQSKFTNAENFQINNLFSLDKDSKTSDCQLPLDKETKNLTDNSDGQFLTDKVIENTDRQFSSDKECKDLPNEELTQKDSKRQKTFSTSDDDYVLCDYGTIDRHEIDSPKEERTDFKFSNPKNESHCRDNLESSKDGFVFPDPNSSTDVDRFRWGFDSTSSMVFNAKTGLPLTSSPAPLRRGNSCFDFDDSINGISGIKSALFQPESEPSSPPTPAPRARREGKFKLGSGSGLLGSFEESALQGRLEAVAVVGGFTAELGASGGCGASAFCPPHRRLPATVYFYAPGGTAAPYMGHISLGPGGYRVARAGTVQVSLFNPHGTLVKMFVVLYDLSRMPPAARTFLRQRTLHQAPQATRLRYLIHLRFMTSKSGKLYLHTDIRLIVSRKADLDTAVAHSALLRPLSQEKSSLQEKSSPNRVFGGSGEHDAQTHELGYDNASFSYELRSVTYAPDKYSPR